MNLFKDLLDLHDLMPMGSEFNTLKERKLSFFVFQKSTATWMKKFLDLIAIEASASFMLCNYKIGISTYNK